MVYGGYLVVYLFFFGILWQYFAIYIDLLYSLDCVSPATHLIGCWLVLGCLGVFGFALWLLLQGCSQ